MLTKDSTKKMALRPVILLSMEEGLEPPIEAAVAKMVLHLLTGVLAIIVAVVTTAARLLIRRRGIRAVMEALHNQAAVAAITAELRLLAMALVVL
jgi:hypothetical protein